MPAVENVLERLRKSFVVNSNLRLEKMEGLLETLSSTPEDFESLDGLMRHFHGLSGLGGTHGFLLTSLLSGQAERDCDEMLRRNLAPRTPDIFRWREQIEAIRNDLRGEGKPHDPVVPVKSPRLSFDILLVGDTQEHLILQPLLEAEGMTVRSAATSAEAMMQLVLREPDGAVIDAELPDGSGYKLIGTLRESTEGDQVAAILISNQSGILDKVEAIRCGADAYFDRPLDWSALTRQMNHLLARTSSAPPRVLSVEDEQDHADLIHAVLEPAGYEVLVISDPSELDHALETFSPELLLLDVKLPGVSGYDLAKYVRTRESATMLPILFLTTEGRIQDRIRGMHVGADDHLVKPVQPALLLSSVSARIERARFLRSLLERDGLTGLLTHTAFLEKVKVAIATGKSRPQYSAALVMLDLDHFKSVNDRFGHPVGDRVLNSLATFLKKRLRQSDLIGRYGGEEFAILLEHLTERDATRLMDNLLEDFRAIELTAPGGERFRTTFSAGVAMLRPSFDVLVDWTSAADRALYAAKDAGRGCVRSAG